MGGGPSQQSHGPPEGTGEAGLLTPARYWRKARAERVSFLVDGATIFAAAISAIRKARRSILLLGWSFDPRTRLQPDPNETEDAADEIGNVLKALAHERPDLDIRILIWKSALPISATQQFFPHRARGWFQGSPVRFLLDSSVPYGACHHQKILVVDDKVAICGSLDFCPDRWDTPAHLDREPRRLMPGGNYHPPRHEVMMMMDGAAARMMGDLVRARWMRAARHAITPPPDTAGPDPWPAWLPPDLEGVDVAVARTEPAWRGRPEVAEVEALHLASILSARRSIYLENQYFTSPLIGEALAQSLACPEGPDIVLVSTRNSPSYFDQLTMDRTRADLISRLRATDRHGRFRAYSPRTSAGQSIIVHSKVTVIDDRLVRIGSANLNNRSGGFDTECDVAVEAQSADQSQVIGRLRASLIAHFAGAAPGDVETLIRERGLGAGVEHLSRQSAGRMAPIEGAKPGPLASLIAAYHLGDPTDASDSWRPFRRRRRLRSEVGKIALEAGASAALIDAEVDH